jgi:penicillin-binding protein 1C
MAYDLVPDSNRKQQVPPARGRQQTPPAGPQPPARGGRTARPATFWRGMGAGSLAFLVFAAFLLGLGLISYAVIAGSLPLPSELEGRASAFQSTRIVDREGNLLNETLDPNAGLRTAVPLDRMSPYLIGATIATEDANFFAHPGVDPVALVRALYYAVLERDIVAGGSTIPQQLVKMLLLSPERTFTRKVNEAVLASEISRTYEKQDILRIYLNEIYYGNFSYGAAAAAETYFKKDVADLTLAEAALLAGLPQLPTYYDPYTQQDRAKRRQGIVLGLMVEQGVITPQEADAAWQEPLTYHPVEFNLEAPHFTLYVRQQLEELLGPAALGAGLRVETTLDPRLQAEAERIVANNVGGLAENNVSNGALVAMRPDTGEILALVGSADFNNVEIDGQVNMALAPRQPGSTIKPLVYLATFEQPGRPLEERWTPGTLIADIREAFPDGANPPYVPENYDGREHGLLPLRQNLGNSYNIPAVRALQQAGIPEFLALAQRTGITTLTRPDYGLSLSLGAGEVPLTEMTSAFAAMGNSGVRRPPVTIRKITDSTGNVLCEMGTAQPCQAHAGAGEQVLNPVDAFLMTDILSDNEARSAAFGPNSLLRLDRPAAVKTGTTNDIRDILTIGYTPQLVTGVWVGNADNSPMRNVSGVTGAAPIWNQFMTVAHAGEPVMEFLPPPGVRQFEVCADTGTQPSRACPERRMRWFAEDRPPLPPERDLWQTFRVDRNTGQLATDATPPDQIEERTWKVYPEPYRAWAQAHGIEQPPFIPPPVGPPGASATAAPVLTAAPTLAAQVSIASPLEGETISGLVTVYGTVNVPNIVSYEIQYGETHDPGAFSPPVAGPYGGVVINDALAQWDTSGLREGPHTLRLLARDAGGAQYETRVRVFVLPPYVEPTPTPVIIEPTPTWTPEPMPLPTDTPFVEPTWTPEPIPPVEPPPAEPPPVEPPAEPPIEMTPTWTPEFVEPGADAGEFPEATPAADAAP